MMSEHKGRSGKKPKYQIADIGGADLTSQDISTERVLNFLIKGEIGSIEQGSSISTSAIVEAEDDVSPSQTPPILLSESSDSNVISSPDPRQKKSLAHLFERANTGGGGATKEFKSDQATSNKSLLPSALDPSSPVVNDVVEPIPSGANHDVNELNNITKASVKSARTAVHNAADAQVRLEKATLQEVSTSRNVTDSSVESIAELAGYIDLWKNFYRLNSGEIDALMAMFRLSQERGGGEFYIKMHNLAEMSKLTYRYCQKVVRTLERLGWITKLKEYDPSNQLGALYRINSKPNNVS